MRRIRISSHPSLPRVRDPPQPEASDEPQVRGSADELRRLPGILREMEPLFHDFVALAILLAVDRTPLTRIRPRFFNEGRGDA